MSLKAIDLKDVKAIVDWVNLTEDVREFSLKFGELELFISRNTQALASQPVALVAPAPVAVTPPPVAAPVAYTPAVVTKPATGIFSSELAADEVLIKAPMVGTFYASPKPGAPNFVTTGDTVGVQTVLCIVEVMKLMNNIEAGVAGTVTRIFVDNEQPVEYGQPLMIIKKHG